MNFRDLFQEFGYQVAGYFNALHTDVATSIRRISRNSSVFFAVLTASGLLVGNAHAAISGNVFRDYNNNGVKDTKSATVSTTDIGISGVTVTAFGLNNTSCGTATTAATGVYSITLSSTAGDCAGPVYRLEFTNLPANTFPSARSTDSVSGGTATNAGSSTQFVSNGATNVNFAANEPCEYCQNNPKIVTTEMFAGGALAPGSAQNALVSLDYVSSGNAAVTKLSSHAQTGSLWGIAYSKQEKVVYSATFLKRQVAMIESPVGTPSVGTLFRTTAPASASPVTTKFVDLEAAPFNIDFGAVASNATRGMTGGSGDRTQDPTTFGQIGKVGIGDIDMSEDGRFLFITNLFNQTIYRLAVDADNNPATPPIAADLTAYPMTAAKGIASCTSGNWRPFALAKDKAGNMYAGGVCDSATGSAANLTASVYRLDQATGNFTTAFSMPLNYPRGFTLTDGVNNCSAAWRSWSDSEAAASLCRNSRYFNPQPLLVDVQFDVDGSMILGFADRYGYQQMANNYRTDSNTAIYLYSGGDILRACASGTSWLQPGSAGCANSISNNEGPGGGEFYYEGRVVGFHDEPSNGALALLPGSGEITNTSMDPTDVVNSGGIKWYSNTSGAALRGTLLFDAATTPGTAWKGHGLGDLELLCDLPPIEIGNRVWLDSNGNGIQDPDETPIAGITVRLYGPVGSGPDGILGTADDAPGMGGLLATAITDANGEYYFSSASGTSTANSIYNVSKLAPNTSGYQLKIDNAADFTSTAKLQSKGLTTPNAGGDTSNNALLDVRDSDATVTTPSALPNATTNVPTITFNTGNAGENNHSLDFGFRPTYSLGNRVWIDADNSGTFNGVEAGVNAVTVNLLDSSGNVIATTTTASGGFYRFDNLPAGDYKVQIAATNFAAGGALKGYASSTPTEINPNDNVDKNDNGIDQPVDLLTTLGISSGTVTLGGASPEPVGETELVAGANPQGPTTDNAANMTVDFGFYPLASLGNFVWLDSNANGRQDAGEAGIPGVEVKLLNADGTPYLRNGIPLTTTTGANGEYLFTDLPAGSYVVEFVKPSGYSASPKDAALAVDATDSDADVVTGRTGAYTLAPGEQNLTVDAGLFFTASLGDRVWHDLNKNGVQDPGEPGVAGVTVNLLDGAGTTILLTIPTDANGNYKFEGLTPGTPYIVEFLPSSLPAGYQFTTQGGGGATSDAADSDANVTTGRTVAFTLTSGVNDPGWDAGVFGPIDLALTKALAPVLPSTGSPYRTGDTVEFTLRVTNNGPATALAGYKVVDTLPAGLTPGAVVSAAGFAPCGFTGQVLTCTGSANLAAGAANSVTIRYRAQISAVGGTLKNVAYVDKAATDPSVETNVLVIPTAATDTVASATNNDAEASLTVVTNYSLGNRVWSDVNNDGIRQATEPGIDDVTVNLFDSTGTNLIATTTTANGGYYRFDNLVAGTYIVKIPGSEFSAGGALEGTVSSTATEIDPNDDGDNNDNGLNVPIALLPSQGIMSGPVVLGPGAPEPINETDFDALGGGGGPLPNNQSNMSVDFGFVPLFSLGNRVWIDTNNDGLINNGEIGKDGVVVELLDTSMMVLTRQSTVGGGYYRFDNLQAGDYKVRVAAVNFQAGGTLFAHQSSTPTEASPNDNIDSNDNGINPASLAAYATDGVVSGTVTLGPTATEPTAELDLPASNPPGEAPDARSNLTVDFGFSPPAALGDKVFRDLNGNGIQDEGEPGISGVTVRLLDGSGNPIAGVPTQTTDTNGNYLFTGLVPGSYSVEFSALPAGLAFTTPNVGADDAADSDAVVATGKTNAVTLVAGETNSTLDAGLIDVAGVSVGNYVWYDLNGNGIQDGTETGVLNVTAVLMRVDGATVTDPSGAAIPVANLTQLTNGSGAYLFTGLAPGQYKVTFSTLPAGYTPTTTNAPSSTLANDSNGLVATSAVLTAGQSDLTLDLGIVPPAGASVGNFVWSDTNGNGIQDGGELGVAGVTATLMRVDGATVTDAAGNAIPAASLVKPTDGNGAYLFAGLAAGQYKVTFSALPAGYTPTTTNAAGSTTANDSNGLVATSAVLTAGQSDLTLDLGLIPPAATYAIGNRVWIDANNNGVLDAGELGLDGVNVRLINTATNAAVTTVTAAGGYYVFSGLASGTYKVEITPPADYVSSTGANGSATGPYETGSADFTLTGDNKDHGTKMAGSNIVMSAPVTVGPGLQPTGEIVQPGSTDTTPDDRSNLTVDFGLFKPATIGSVVWIDNGAGGGIAGDGVKQAAEPGIAAVIVRLLDGAGAPVLHPVTRAPITATTDSSGNYSIGYLVAGNYQVEFVFPAGTVTTTINPAGAGNPTTNAAAGGADAQRNEMNPVTRRSPIITLAAGADNPNLDSGVRAFAADEPISVPTLNTWMLMLLAMMMLGCTARGHRWK
jgi:uncharacterized repeat protein (TIGR01451 family)